MDDGLLPIEKARANSADVQLGRSRDRAPWFLGRRYVDDVPLAEIAKFIDWTFFFTAWELKRTFSRHPG
jgi:cobalamin-dependent methionine synthase I